MLVTPRKGGMVAATVPILGAVHSFRDNMNVIG
jgi:hypothetical protein